jgi:hypothetical protein
MVVRHWLVHAETKYGNLPQLASRKMSRPAEISKAFALRQLPIRNLHHQACVFPPAPRSNTPQVPAKE